MVPAVVPVKALTASKSRLWPHLGHDGALRLTIAMLGDVLEALLGVRELGRVAVVTPDPEVAEAARDAGAGVFLRPDPGLNAAIESASADLAPDPAGGLLVVLGDVAGARASEIALLLRALEEQGGRGVVLAPSSDGGTSALLRNPAHCIPERFGPNSAKRHRDLAARADVPFREMALPSLALDIDEPEDLDRLLCSRSGGTRTRDLLRELAGKSAS